MNLLTGAAPILTALIAGVLLGALAMWLVARERAAAFGAQLAATASERDLLRARVDEVLADREAMVNEFKVLAHETLDGQARRADESAEIRQRATEQVLRPVRESLEALNRRLADVEAERAGLVSELSAQVQSVRLTGEQVRRETAALATALRKPQVRGAWGEVQLRRVVELAGMVEHCDFEVQATATSDDRTIRPDLKVTLAGGRFLYVDSKVPLSSFLDAHEADDPAHRQSRLEAFVGNVRSHVDALGAKSYFRAGTSSPEFVVLFVPSEALASTALELQPDLHEYASKRNVVLATPSTLIAMLRAVEYGWRQAALAESASEVFALGRELYDRLGSLGAHFDRLGRALNGTVRAYNVALGSLETRVLVTGRRLRDLKVSDADLAAPRPVDEQPRGVTAPELLADAVNRQTLPEASALARPSLTLDDLVEREGPRQDRSSAAG